MRRSLRLLTALPLLLAGCTAGEGQQSPADGSPEAAPTARLGAPTVAAELLPRIVAPGVKPAAANGAEALLHVWRRPGVDRTAAVEVVVTRTDGGRDDVVAEALQVPRAGVGIAVPAGTGARSATYRVERVEDGAVAERPARVALSSWRLDLDDQFSGNTLDPVWQVRTSAEQETCSRKVEGVGQHSRNRNVFTRDMVRVVDGVAVVGVTDRAHSTVCPDGRLLRQSGHVGTEATRSFSGGRFMVAARIRMPSVDGPHAAFWMRGIGPVSKSSTPRVPAYEDMAEMDIAEFFGPESNANCRPGGLVRDNGVDKSDWAKLQTNFYYNYAAQEIEGFRHCISNAQLRGSGSWGKKPAWDGYHVYAVDWSPNRHYRVWFDGVLVRTFDGPELSSGRASFLALSQLIDDGDAHYAGPATQKQVTIDGKEYKPGADYLTADDLSAMKVDWVRVWRAS